MAISAKAAVDRTIAATATSATFKRMKISFVIVMSYGKVSLFSLHGALALETGGCKVSVVVDNGPRGVGVRVNAVSAQVIAGVPGSEHEVLAGGALIHINRVDPVSVGVFRRQAKRAVGAGFGRVIVQRQRVHVAQRAAQIGHAPQSENVAGKGAGGVGPAGVHGFEEAAAVKILRGAAVGSAQDLRGGAAETVGDLGVRAVAAGLSRLADLEFLAVQAVAKGLLLHEG